jgi:hypothetical protein
MESCQVKLIESGPGHGSLGWRVSHPLMAELHAEASTSQTALAQLARRLEVALAYAEDEFYRDPVRRALCDVNKLVEASRGKSATGS